MCHLEENIAKYQPVDFLFFQKITFRIRMFYLNITRNGLPRVCPETEQYLYPICVFTMGVKTRSELDDRCFLAGVNNECNYGGCVDECD